MVMYRVRECAAMPMETIYTLFIRTLTHSELTFLSDPEKPNYLSRHVTNAGIARAGAAQRARRRRALRTRAPG